MTWGRGRVVLVVVLGLVLGACGGGSGDDDAEPTPTSGTPTTVEEEPAADPAASIVTVETALASGTGLIYEDGYVVAPASVVDPFFAVEVHVAGDPRPASVVGVDLVTGLAVIGPVDLSGAPATPIDPGPVEPQSEVSLLVGAEPGDDAEPTVVEGTIDALAQRDDWPIGLIDVAVDEEIETLGAPVVTDDGRVVGLGGFAADSGIEVAVDAATALAAIEEIRGGDGDWPRIPQPADAFEQQATVDLSYDGTAALYFPSDWHAGRQELTLPPDADVQLEVVSYANEVLLVNPQAAAAGLGEEDGADVVEPSADGTYELTFPTDGTEVAVLVYLTVPEGAMPPTALEVTSSYDFLVADPVPEAKGIAVGDEVEGLVGAFEDTARFTVELAAGETITVTAASPVGDVAVEVRGPDGAVVAEAEDGSGYLGLDATTDLTAEAAGAHEVRVRQQDGIAAAYRLTIE